MNNANRPGNGQADGSGRGTPPLSRAFSPKAPIEKVTVRNLMQNRTPANPHAAMLATTFVAQIKRDYEAAMVKLEAKRPKPKGQETAQPKRTAERQAFLDALDAAWPKFEEDEKARSEQRQALLELPL